VTDRLPRLSLLASSIALFAAASGLRAQQFTPPTPEELSMTSIPEVPGARAVYLYKEELAYDGLHYQSFYYRVKILNEAGRDLANVELPYYTEQVDGIKLGSIEGRTIHPDGTVIPFTGKPYEKLIAKRQVDGVEVQKKEKIFTLPSVEVGSIIEYRYRINIPDHYFLHPNWFVQSDLFTRKAHYMWRPTDQILTDEKGDVMQETVAWTPILPPGVAVQSKKLSLSSEGDFGHMELDLDVADVPPVTKEDFMPPVESLSYRVLFYYTPYTTTTAFWTKEGKRWSKKEDRFIGPGSVVKNAAKALVAPDDPPLAKLKKLYAEVMTYENTDFTRARTSDEGKETRTADDVVKRKLGSGDEIALTFVALARAAGLKAYAMGVANRGQRVFLPGYLALDQLDDDIAIVNVDGKDMFFDPGERYCPFGHLSWQHAYTAGLRQTADATELAATPASPFKDNHTNRIADLKLDEHGVATGTVKIDYTGDPALAWRQAALRGDATSLNADLKARLESEMPSGLDISVVSVQNPTEFEQPLKVAFAVNGPIGSSTGKRLLLPVDPFEARAKPKFSDPKREHNVDMHYASQVQDAVRFTFPGALAVESAPAPAKTEVAGTGAFETVSKPGPNSITLFRNFTLGKVVCEPKDYPELRKFYNQLEAEDHETVVLSHSDAKSSGGMR
jgi:hypothetical protein